MSRLVVNPDTAAAWEFQLEPGPNSLGSGQENRFPIEHPSVSAAHCQITVMNSGTIIKDLGSTGGTWVDGACVEEAVLLPGQTIRIGDVLMRYEREPRPSAIPPRSVAAAPPDHTFCKFHPKAIARFCCPKCSSFFCELCVNTRSMNGHPRKFCRTCSEECAVLSAKNDAGAEDSRTFASQVPAAFVYPLQADGWILLAGGTVFYLVLQFVARHAFILGAAVMMFGSGYLVAYVQRILVTSATGEDHMPDWPDFTSLGDLLAPVFQFLATALTSFAAMIALRAFAAPDSPGFAWAMAATVAFGCIYFPMAFTGVALFDSIAAVNPLLVIPSIIKIPLAYFLTVILLVACCALAALGDRFLPGIIPVPVLPEVIHEFLGLYLFAVEMRLLGLMYRTKKDELGWFNR